MTRTQRLRPAFLAALLIALAICTAATLHLGANPVASRQPSAARVLRVYYNDIADVARLHDYDVWEHNPAGRYVLVAVDDAAYRALRAEGWRIAVDASATAQLRAAAGYAPFADGYRTVEQLYSDLAAANDARPQLTELVTYGRSHCLAAGGCDLPGGDTLAGFPLLAMRITNEAIPGASTVGDDAITRGQKPVLVIIAATHAREITTPEIAMRLLDLLLDGYSRDPDLTWLVDWHETWIVPVVNPDGHWLVAQGERPELGGAAFFQRKNLNLDSDGDGGIDCPAWPPTEGGPQFGIDLNRNHSFGWGGEGSSDDPCSLVFRGAGETSEPEIAHLETLVRALIPDQRGPAVTDAAPDDTTGLLITLHSYGELILWPWGHIDEAAPNMAGLQAIGDKLATFNGYWSCQGAALGCLYPAAGASDDWAYGELGIPAFTFEVGKQFMPSYPIIDETQWPENRPALLYAAKIARTPYQTVRGPDVRDISLAPSEGGFVLTATADDQRNGGQSIAAAEYTIDAPPWQSGTPIAALDVIGTDAGAVAGLWGVLPTGDLPPGRHLLFVRARDAGGNWGPNSAAFFDVATPGGMLFLPSVLGP